MTEKRIEVAVPGQVNEGELLAIDAEGVPVLLSRVDGRVCAVINRCPHMGMKMSRGHVCDGVVTCPWHGSRFELRSGENVDWVNAFAGVPMPRWTHRIIAMGKSPAGLTTLPVEERADAIIVSLPG